MIILSLSPSKRGNYIRTDAIREKQRLAMKDKPSPMKGKRHSLEARIRISILAKKRYQNPIKRALLLEAFTFKGFYHLEADHIIPFSIVFHKSKISNYEEAINCKELWDINNGRTLCPKCHRATSTFGVKAKFYEGISLLCQ